MINHLPASQRPSRWRLRVLSSLSCLVLGASQAIALPQVELDPRPGFLPVQAAKPGEEPGSKQQAQADQQASWAELNQLLEATRAKLEELSSATATLAEQRKEIEALREGTERLNAELQQANARRTELEDASKLAEARIAELTQAVDVAVQEAARMDEELAGERRQNAALEESLARADSAREAAEAEAAQIRTDMQAELEAAKDAAEQSGAELAGLREELERSARELATAEQARQQIAARASELEQAVERSGADAERVETELAEVKEQLGQAASVAVEAERARQAASSEADQLRDEAERAREELVAAKSEIERFRTANAELEEQIASLYADSESAMETARQSLVVMEDKIEELHAALAGAGLVEAPPTGRPQPKPDTVAAERSTGSNLLSGTAQPAAPEPAAEVGPEQEAASPAQLAAQRPSGAPAQDVSPGLARFDANVRYLNTRAFEAAGAYLFSGIEPAGDGVVHVSTTQAWESIPPAGQRSYLNSLYDLWTVAQDGTGPAVVRIVDASGRVLLEKSDVARDGASE